MRPREVVYRLRPPSYLIVVVRCRCRRPSSSLSSSSVIVMAVRRRGRPSSSSSSSVVVCCLPCCSVAHIGPIVVRDLDTTETPAPLPNIAR
ncbi:hypothetical protein Cob_v001331 [Colletotrichum orbiculare MAFF 240422]|uniref:Uncharacterized protein n=1 Tax=Colletotrichum orbiculare (strain 104-T / ATCC 96160 / CBS 514.97 / LARS 414 / MAFF 240422) TaxID=1213857 RepID=A0A484G641_COLOR|nr:hypothetical protein Cob_v001331 [Colletotrichum orbiculare MAFF 240422]